MYISSGFRSMDFSRFLVLSSTFLISSIASIPAYSVDFEDKNSGMYGSFDTTVTYGRTHRAQSSSADLIGIANGGTAFSANGDDGNLNYNA